MKREICEFAQELSTRYRDTKFWVEHRPEDTYIISHNNPSIDNDDAFLCAFGEFLQNKLYANGFFDCTIAYGLHAPETYYLNGLLMSFSAARFVHESCGIRQFSRASSKEISVKSLSLKGEQKLSLGDKLDWSSVLSRMPAEYITQSVGNVA